MGQRESPVAPLCPIAYREDLKDNNERKSQATEGVADTPRILASQASTDVVPYTMHPCTILYKDTRIFCWHMPKKCCEIVSDCQPIMEVGQAWSKVCVECC